MKQSHFREIAEQIGRANGGDRPLTRQAADHSEKTGYDAIASSINPLIDDAVAHANFAATLAEAARQHTGGLAQGQGDKGWKGGRLSVTRKD